MQNHRSDDRPRLKKPALTNIGEGLQKQYAPPVNEPLPPRLRELAAQIARDLRFSDDVDPSQR
jgi:hypothetical protein